MPAYTLPDPLKLEAGTPVRNAQEWREKRRPELLHLFETWEYGRSPGRPEGMTFVKDSEEKQALGGLATRREISIYLTKEKHGPVLHLLLYVPNKSPKPAPAFLGLNFEGNHTISKDPGIAITTNWVPNDKELGVTNHVANASSRGGIGA